MILTSGFGAVFTAGKPRASGDDPEAAVRAALDRW